MKFPSFPIFVSSFFSGFEVSIWDIIAVVSIALDVTQVVRADDSFWVYRLVQRSSKTMEKATGTGKIEGGIL
jgi:hypothetical protein